MVTEETDTLIQSHNRKVAVPGFWIWIFHFPLLSGRFCVSRSIADLGKALALLGRRASRYISEFISSSQFLKRLLVFLNESWVAKPSLYV